MQERATAQTVGIASELAALSGALTLTRLPGIVPKVMYAIIESGGKPYKVAEGDVIRCDLVASDVGSDVTFDRVVMAGSGDAVRVGTPTLDGASVSGTVLRQAKDARRRLYGRGRSAARDQRPSSDRPG